MSPVRPVVDRDSAEWWALLATGVLAFQRCSRCLLWRWPARALCNGCGSLAWRWEPASGTGEIVSWIVTRHAFLPDVPAPYAVLSVRAAEQPDLLLPGAYAGPPDDPRLAIGAPVTAEFVPLTGEGAPAALLRWSIIQSSA
ncbi:Zn-ribbon domain-containing OB-fold protein [Yinghuangia seranimata]|uniref:Zn-ribbon domain-containing OB-fold protein n=1 Tax=Yinghuangia seranimata TaxID=408067 RepID=UPI00248BEC90|nr:OB-fold domain-containing protein [Yinghuangia seranimata]MDI2127182.1 OB-fold domain-containing protein [Yinghuangia seranimata]